jgi:cytochrome c peroxidase
LPLPPSRKSPRPNFYDGQVSTLPEAIRLMAWMQLDTKLEFSEIDEIICFLNTLDSERPDKLGEL